VIKNRKKWKIMVVLEDILIIKTLKNNIINKKLEEKKYLKNITINGDPDNEKSKKKRE
jgi:hypothetical protein